MLSGGDDPKNAMLEFKSVESVHRSVIGIKYLRSQSNP